MMKNKKVTIFGGTGFVGRQIIRELAAAGANIRVATRRPEKAYFLRPCGVVGQIVPVAISPNDPKSLRAVIDGSDYVVNCIGILSRKRRGDFQRLHTDLPGEIAKACADLGVDRLVHISALGVDKGRSRYAKTKLAGETAIHDAFPKATILRPSVIFGPQDNFFNMFAGMAGVMPALPLIGGGKTKFQPVYVGDVADCVLRALTLSPANGKPEGKIYDLGGPEILSFKEIYKRMFDITGRKVALLPVPWLIARVQSMFLSLLPNPPLTPDQVTSLKTDSIIGNGTNVMEDLGITPTGMDLILPTYLNRYRAGGHGKIFSPNI